MSSNSMTIDKYLAEIPEERKIIIEKLRKTIKENLPKGFEEGMQYGMIGYFVPHKTYPSGYHCNQKDPLPFMSLASQKNTINIYHLGLYSNNNLLDWFVNEYSKFSSKKLDMGKSCIRFKNIEVIPFELIGELSKKITVKEWIYIYEISIKK